jgi:hypothetical protein
MAINSVHIDIILERIAVQGAFRFNAYQVAALSKEENIDEVNEYLLFKSKFGVLKAKFEFLCPDNHPDFQIDLGQEIPDNSRECRICEEEYTPDSENSHLVYYFHDQYIEDVKKKVCTVKQKQAI